MKKGSASIYIVVISCILFGIIAVSFIQLIVNERKKSIENDLAQSAYDSALAGVEDAKLALSKYYQCLNDGYSLSTTDPDYDTHNSDPDYHICATIINYIEISPRNDASGNPNCDSVAKILARNGTDGGGVANGGEVLIEETSSPSADTIQAYTCVQIATVLNDYRSTLDSSVPTRIVPLYEITEGGDTPEVTQIRLSWFSQANYDSYGTNFANIDGSSVVFPANGEEENTEMTPSVLSFSLFQTAHQFNLEDLDSSNGSDKTDRGTIWLVPSSGTTTNTPASNSPLREALIRSSSHSVGAVNTPQTISCIDPAAVSVLDSEYLCTATIDLPKIKDSRDDITGRYDKGGGFFVAVNLPYESPETDFSLEMLDSSGNVVPFDNVQVLVDSTGRANDIYSRVESRIEFRDIFFPIPTNAIEATSNGGSGGKITKSIQVPGKCWYVTNGSVHTTDGVCRDDI